MAQPVKPQSSDFKSLKPKTLNSGFLRNDEQKHVYRVPGASRKILVAMRAVNIVSFTYFIAICYGGIMAREQIHRVTVQNLAKSQIWKVWEDINRWHLWDTDIEYARMTQPFQSGSSFVLKPKGGPKVKITLAQVELGTSFTDMASFPLATMYSIHTLRETSGGLEIAHTVRVEGALGFLWWKLVAGKVAAGMEEQTNRMVQRAREVQTDG